jgi:hypothetical protein
MTNEELQRTMEFIIEHQARFAARMEEDEGRIARLEGAFVTLVEIARITDERQDKTDQRVDRFDEKLTALADAQLLSEGKLAELALRLTHLSTLLNVTLARGTTAACSVERLVARRRPLSIR